MLIAIYITNYVILLLIIGYLTIASIKLYYFNSRDTESEIVFSNLKKDDEILEAYFKKVFIIFDFMRTFRPICFIFIMVFGGLSVYTDLRYNFIFISESTARFFVVYYLLITMLILFITLCSIAFTSAYMTYLFIKTGLSFNKYALSAGSLFFVVITTCVPIIAPPEFYNDKILNYFQEIFDIPKYRTQEETEAFRRLKFLRLWDNTLSHKSFILPNGRINVSKINDLINDIMKDILKKAKKP